MNRRLQIGLGAAGALALAAAIYIGFSFGSAEAKVERALPQLRAEIEEARSAGLDWNSLPPALQSILLAVEDPAFFEHGGLDFGTPGAGITTITQGLCKRVFWEEFRPGLAKWEQSLLAMALERELSKTDILTLFLRYVELGRQDGRWTIGLDAAARARFGQPAAALSENEFIELVALMISPGLLTAPEGQTRLDERIRRINALLDGRCAPDGHGDVWLNGCG